MEELKNPQRDSVRRFLKRWYGLDGDGGSTTSSQIPESPQTPRIPRELAEWHRAAAATGIRITFQDHPVALAELTRSEDGMIVFWVENQSGYYWAIDADREERQVFVRECASDEWRDTGESLDRFLLHCTVQEALIGTESKFSAVVPDSVLHGALADFSALPFRPFASESPLARLLCSGNALARVAPPPVGYAPADESSWMLTIATARGEGIEEYRPGLDPYILARPERPQPVEVSFDDLPF